MCAQLVAPKRKRLAEAESLLAQQMSHLNEKRGELKEVMDKLQNLNDDYRSKVNKKRVRVIKPYFLFKYRYRMKRVEKLRYRNTLTYSTRKLRLVCTDRSRQEFLTTVHCVLSMLAYKSCCESEIKMTARSASSASIASSTSFAVALLPVNLSFLIDI